eukprot:TRINITY_DN5314_c0_g2_i1.p1 TRINITY_DN5314_c0_g2~~TRINITY_DN5314_c0_g2_i1.p1  ORF type:complete len:195 (+),score=45.09 TRINITY_DN5314_c0_g2_i1:39-587(+)
MALYGWALYCSVGIAEDGARATELLQQSKHPLARTTCAMYLIEGEPREEACQRLSTECDTSDLHVQYLLGWCLYNGLGCTTDFSAAVRCFERAGNHVRALYCLATAVELGCGVRRDNTRAAKLYEQAAEQGYAVAQFNLGQMHRVGKGVPQSYQHAKHWMQMAADQGHRTALDMLQATYLQI